MYNVGEDLLSFEYISLPSSIHLLNLLNSFQGHSVAGTYPSHCWGTIWMDCQFIARGLLHHFMIFDNNKMS